MKKKSTMAASTSNLTKIATWSGIPVHIDAHGTFYAQVDDIEIRADKLETVRTKIDAALKPSAKKVPMSLPIIVYDEDEGKFTAAVITGVSRTNRSMQLDPPVKTKSYRRKALADTEANRKLVDEYIIAKKASDTLAREIRRRDIEVSGYGRIEIEAYDDVVAKLTAAHKHSSSK